MTADYGSRDYNDGRAHTGAACTLDGAAAKVIGRSLDFATVATLDPCGPAVDFAWSTVARVMRQGGNFRG